MNHHHTQQQQQKAGEQQLSEPEDMEMEGTDKREGDDKLTQQLHEK
jgi:hypothetical protein